MAIKAVHLEVVSDLTTNGFLAALQRFMVRRSMPAHIHLNNGTNFVRANNQLKEMYVLINSDEHKDRIKQFATEHRIMWYFIPPLAPQFGGLVPASRLTTWQHKTKVRQDFWTRWSLEYLNKLQVRSIWIKDGIKLGVGTVVLIKEKNLSCTQ